MEEKGIFEKENSKVSDLEGNPKNLSEFPVKSTFFSVKSTPNKNPVKRY